MQLFMALSTVAEQHVRDFKTQNLVNTFWALAKVAQPERELFAAMARAEEHRMSELLPENLAETAWAFAKACQADEKLFAALAIEAKPRIIGHWMAPGQVL